LEDIQELQSYQDLEVLAIDQPHDWGWLIVSGDIEDGSDADNVEDEIACYKQAIPF
jgi:hypothetical protein